jgi:hypothetical protein
MQFGESMAISRQWTEWHLTPAGWVSGSSRRDGEGNVWRDEPNDRVITFVYQEQTSKAQTDKAHPEPHATVQESWRSKAAGATAHIEQLLAQHGPCPQNL